PGARVRTRSPASPGSRRAPGSPQARPARADPRRRASASPQAPDTLSVMPRRALVTGGAGFIGSHLSEALLAAGWEVFVLDDGSTGSLDNVAHLRDRRDYHLVVDSVLSPSVVSEVVHKCDVVFHMAAAVGVRLIVEQPVHTMVTNVQGTETVLGYCSKFGKRVLIASSFELYGDHREERPLAETDRRIYGPTTEK